MWAFELANAKERAILDALFDLSRPEIVKRVQAGTLDESALTAHDYIHDIFEGAERERKRA